MDNYGISKFSLEVEVAGEKYQAVQFQMSFGLNAIPKATALLAVGRNARDVSDVARIHKTAGSLTYLQPAKIWFEPSGIRGADGSSWPQGRTLIFEGYLEGLSYRKSNGNVQMVMNFTHWLSDLQYSSCISEISHPDNPHSYTYRAVKTLEGTGAGGQPSWLGQFAPTKFFETGQITGDFWNNALLPFFKALAGEDLFRATGRDAGCIDLGQKVNRQALTALERMGPGGAAYVPLTLQAGPLGRELGEAISRGIMDTIGDSDFFQSFWDNLTVKLGPEFCFSIVPQIDRAYAAPVVPGLRTYYDRQILATDQDYVDLRSELPRPLRAVAIYNTFYSETQTNFAGTDVAPDYDVGPGGCYAPAGTAEARGQVLVRRAPRWMTSVAAATALVGATDSVYTKSATTPDGGGPKAAKSPAQAVRDTKTMANNYCHYLYMCEALRGRTGSVAGKFRLDIAPGSTVRIHGNPEKFLGGEDVLGTDMVGLVHTVTCALDAEGSKAGTGLGFTHLRTIHENSDDRTSVPQHPLYSTAFIGAPLIDSMA